MRCHEASRLLPLFLDSELSPEVTLAMEEHFETCEDCRSRLEAERGLEDSMRAALLEPHPLDAATWDRAAALAVRSGRRGGLTSTRAVALAAAAVSVVVVGFAIVGAPHRELDLARSAASDHARFIVEVSEEALPPATMVEFLDSGRRTLPQGTSLPAELPTGYGLLKTGQCKLDGAPVTYVVMGRRGEPISVFLMARDALRRFPRFAKKLDVEPSGVSCQAAGRRFFGAGNRSIVVCAVGRANPDELRKLVGWALMS